MLRALALASKTELHVPTLLVCQCSPRDCSGLGARGWFWDPGSLAMVSARDRAVLLCDECCSGTSEMNAMIVGGSRSALDRCEGIEPHP